MTHLNLLVQEIKDLQSFHFVLSWRGSNENRTEETSLIEKSL